MKIMTFLLPELRARMMLQTRSRLRRLFIFCMAAAFNVVVLVNRVALVRATRF